MGFMYVTAQCAICTNIVNFNPNSVPSHNNQPICRPCVEKINIIRKQKGLHEIPIADDAYEAIDENEPLIGRHVINLEDGE